MTPDPFEDLARYYDSLMSHVDYDRWYMVTTMLADLVSGKPRHLDAACGTGVLAKRLLRDGWNTTAIDLSPSMITIARNQPPYPAAAVADLRALPFARTFDLITCLFDSVNFLLTLDDVERAVAQCAGALNDHGILYFDIVTERMVTEYFEGQEWIEDNATFSTRWRSTYDRSDSIAETRIRVNRGHESIVRERIYPLAEIREAVHRAGLTVLGAVDARTWRAPTARTVRVAIIATRSHDARMRKRFKSLHTDIGARLRGSDY